MAFVWKHPQSKYWIARFFDVHGKRRNRSTRSTSRREAESIAASYEKIANKKRTVRHVRQVIAELHQEISGEELRTQTLREFTTAWLERKSTEIAPGTLSFYGKTISKFIAYLGVRADEEMADITSEDIVAFRNLGTKTLAAQTVNHDLKGLRMLFRAARRDKIIGEDPCEFVSLTKKGSTPRRRPFTVPELRAVIGVADDEWRSMIFCGLYTGQRLGDIAGLTWEGVDLQRREIRMVTRKTGKKLHLPIAPPLQKHLKRLASSQTPGAPLHPRAFGILQKQGKTGNLSNQFADLLATAGLRPKQSHHKAKGGNGREHKRASGGLSFHCIRHTAVSMLKDAGIPAAVVMELVGHDSEQMSEHYTHVGDAALKRATDAFPNITK